MTFAALSSFDGTIELAVCAAIDPAPNGDFLAVDGDLPIFFVTGVSSFEVLLWPATV